MWSIITLGLAKGHEAYKTKAWFLSTRVNWNCEFRYDYMQRPDALTRTCVVNGGIVIATLAIYYDDATEVSKELLELVAVNTRDNCA